MAIEKLTAPAVLVCLLTLLLSLTAATGVSEIELDRAMSTLRTAGYNLFPNAIATTDLRYRLLTVPPNSSFTLFAPPDSFLFTLDFTSPSAHYYFLSLLRHVAPLGLSSSELLGLSRHIGPDRPSLIPTLMPNFSLQLRVTPFSAMTVSGVRISSPDVHLGRGLAVHGLERTLSETSSLIPEDFYVHPGSSHRGSGSFSSVSVAPSTSPSPSPSPAQHQSGEIYNHSHGSGSFSSVSVAPSTSPSPSPSPAQHQSGEIHNHSHGSDHSHHRNRRKHSHHSGNHNQVLKQ